MKALSKTTSTPGRHNFCFSCWSSGFSEEPVFPSDLNQSCLQAALTWIGHGLTDWLEVKLKSLLKFGTLETLRAHRKSSLPNPFLEKGGTHCSNWKVMLIFLNLVHENLEYKVAVADVCCCPSSYFGMSSSLYLIHAWHRPPVEKLPHIGTVDGHMPAPAKQLYGEYHKQRCSIKIVGLLLNNPLKLNITTVKVEAYEFPVAPCGPYPNAGLKWSAV